jgi:hypothetical protein
MFSHLTVGKRRAMDAAISRTVRLSAAAGALSAAFAVIGVPIAVAQADDLVCSDGLVASAGTCVPPTNDAPASLALPQDSSSSLDNPSLFVPPDQLTESEVATPGFNAVPGGDSGGDMGGGGFAGDAGGDHGGGHGR